MSSAPFFELSGRQRRREQKNPGADHCCRRERDGNTDDIAKDEIAVEQPNAKAYAN